MMLTNERAHLRIVSVTLILFSPHSRVHDLSLFPPRVQFSPLSICLIALASPIGEYIVRSNQYHHMKVSHMIVVGEPKGTVCCTNLSVFILSIFFLRHETSIILNRDQNINNSSAFFVFLVLALILRVPLASSAFLRGSIHHLESTSCSAPPRQYSRVCLSYSHRRVGSESRGRIYRIFSTIAMSF